MRIAQIVCTYPPYHGGMGNVVYQTASELAKLGHDVEVLTPHYFEEDEIEIGKAGEMESVEEQKEVERDLNVQARRLKPALQKGNAAYIPQVQKELDDFDLVHLHYPFFGVANLVRKWKKRNPHKPLVITYHMDNRAPGWLGLYFKYYAKFWMPKILNSADLLIASSLDYIENSDARNIYLENKDKWMELPFGVDIERFQPRKKQEDLYIRHGLDKKQPILLFVGGMDRAHHFKGISIFLKSLKKIREDGVELQVILVGEGDLRESYQIQSKFLGLSNSVKFVGKISNEELPYYYNLADLFVLPSINSSEAFGMVLLESMSSGVPVVASDLAGVRTVARAGGELVEPNNYFDLAETIISFFDNNVDREQRGEEVRSLVENKYSWSLIASKLSDVYQQLV
jgi:glycosyltransferase involved in cell wall biosynthesis